METVNINIGPSSLRTGWPLYNDEGGMMSIPEAIAAGWREVVRVDSAPAGCYIIRQGVKDLDGRTAALTVVSYDIQRGPEPTPEPAIYGDPSQEYIRMDLGLSSRRFDTPRDIITPKGNVQGATLAECESIGWRRLAETVQPPAGMTATAWGVEEIDGHTCKVVCTSWVDPVEEERKRKEAEEEAERQRQLNKSLDQKIAENGFLSICDTLTQSTSHAKLSFDQLRAIINTLPNEQQVYFFMQLQANDSQLQREAGLKWWDDVIWHPEIVEEPA